MTAPAPVQGAAALPALQDALAGEHAAVWAFGRAAALLTGADRAAALSGLEAHRRARDTLSAAIVAQANQPVPAAANYAQPFPVTGPRSARRLLAHVERALCPLYAALAGASAPEDRTWSIRRARQCAVAAVQWGAQPEAFPGR